MKDSFRVLHPDESFGRSSYYYRNLVAKRSKLSNKENQEDKEEEERVDRISSLTRPILCHILSFLPTKDAVATSILSRTWRKIWQMVPVLDFGSDYGDNELYDSEYEREIPPPVRFDHIVNRVMAAHTAPHLRKFRYYCVNVKDLNNFDGWVFAAVARNVEKIRIQIESGYTVSGYPVILPLSVYTCRSLVSLKLILQLRLQVPMSVHLPNLKFMQLTEVFFEDEDALQRFFSGCPVLLVLVVSRSESDELTNYKIDIPTLKQLSFSFFESGIIGNDSCNLEINTPALEYLHIKDHWSNSFSIQNVPNLVGASVDLGIAEQYASEFEDYGYYVCELVSRLYNAKVLQLRRETCKILYKANDFHPPVFVNLIRLRLQSKCCEWQDLTKFLGNAPKLEALLIEKKDYQTHGRPESCSEHKSCLNLPNEVPKCLSSSLETFSFVGFECFEHELRLVEYILAHAKVLKEMKIFWAVRPKYYHRKHIVTSQILSHDCYLKFYHPSHPDQPNDWTQFLCTKQSL